MDGDERQRKHYGPSSYQISTSTAASPNQQLSFQSGDRFAQNQQPMTRGESSRSSIGRSAAVPSYGGYGYPDQQGYGTHAIQEGSMHGASIQYPTNFSQGASRQQQTQQLSPPQQYPPYGSNVVYNIPQQSQTQAPYDTVSPFQPRQPAAIDVLPNQFGVPQYFASGPPSSAGLPPGQPHYVTSQDEAPSYPHQSPAERQPIQHSYPVDMSEYPPLVPADPPEHEPLATVSDGIDEAYRHYQQQLRLALDSTREGRLAGASEELMSLSRWFLGNVVKLGLNQDNQDLHSDRIKLWKDFNICWLALGQKQKDATLEMIKSRTKPPNLLPVEALEGMIEELLSLCDQIEPHGLVDYDMGVWEEEIVSVFTQCVDLLQQNERTQTTAQRSSSTRI